MFVHKAESFLACFVELVGALFQCVFHITAQSQIVAAVELRKVGALSTGSKVQAGKNVESKVWFDNDETLGHAEAEELSAIVRLRRNRNWNQPAKKTHRKWVTGIENAVMLGGQLRSPADLE